MAVTALSFPADHVITGKEIQQFNDFLTPLYVRKTAAEFVNSSTVLQDDNDLFLRLKANATYQFRTFIKIQGATAGDFQMVLTAPTGSTIAYFVAGPDQTKVSASAAEDHSYNPNSAFIPIYATVTGSTLVIMPRGIVVTSTVDGYLRLTWAQGTSSATSTVVDSGSFMVARRVG